MEYKRCKLKLFFSAFNNPDQIPIVLILLMLLETGIFETKVRVYFPKAIFKNLEAAESFRFHRNRLEAPTNSYSHSIVAGGLELMS